MGGAAFPPCWLFSLRWPSTGAYRPFGGANGRLWEGSHQGVLPRTSAVSVLVPTVSHRHPVSAGDPPTLAGRSGSVSYGATPPFPGSWSHTTLCVPSKSGVSVSPGPIDVLQSNPASLQSLILWELLLLWLDPQVGNPDMGLRTLIPVGGLLWYKCSPVCESPNQQLWDLILLWLCPSFHLIVVSPLSVDVGCLFWWVPVCSCWWLFSS